MVKQATRTAIIGIGETETGKVPHLSVLGMHMEAIRLALDDAGIDKEKIDGVITNQPLNDPFRSYANYLGASAGLEPTFATDLALGGATPVAMAQVATMAIQAGLCDTVVCVHGRKNATATAATTRGGIRNGTEDFEEPFGLIGPPAYHALAAKRHMYEYGTTNEHLGAIAIAQRNHAHFNEAASQRDLIDMDAYLSSRWIVRPFRLFDCSLVSDGGGAFIVTGAKTAQNHSESPVYIRGYGQHHRRNNLLDPGDLTTGGGKVSSQMAYRMAKVAPDEIDVAEIYDCFTIAVLITLEDYGFCGKGEGGPWAADGNVDIDGRLPVNTHGGLLSQDHVEGMLHITEAVKQLRGGEVEPERQVTDASLAIVSGHGGDYATHGTLILSKELE